jgi:hypothetical protein
MGSLPEPAVPAYRMLSVPWKRWQVLGASLNCSESAEPHGARFISLSRAGRAFLERAGRCQATDGCLADAIGAGQIGLHSALRESPDSFFPLVCGQLQRPAKSYATGLCLLAAVIGASPDQLALELGQAAQHGQHQPAMRRSGIYRASAPKEPGFRSSLIASRFG